MKRAFCVAAVACLAALSLVVLAGCSGIEKSQFQGDWTIESSTDANYDEDSLELMESLGLHVTLTLNGDGTGSFDEPGGAREIAWETVGASEAKGTLDGTEISIVLEDGKLTMSGLPKGDHTFIRVT